ncbi:NACHT domain-containing protein [Amycolatopsis magusensis]|uniref:NACHT domain-containing protein n=1 Tax=Amycolatopsis magusensis TaxID=882444 RepID=UPI0037AE220B
MVGAVVCLVVAVVMGLQWVPGVKVGDVDPVSVVVALLALAAALWAGRHAARTARMTPVPVVEMAARLTDEVRAREGRARTQLLGQNNRTIDVDFAFRPAPAHPARHARSKGRLAEVVDYYQALQPQRLVITGAPGAGKTVLALELLMGLLETRSPDQPVPVRIPATLWDTSHPLGEWLVQHLVIAYHKVLDQRTAQALVDAGLILPVIDGLDEVDAEDTPGHTSRAAHVVRVLNTYQHGRHAAPLVLTCRTGHYQALTDAEVWTHDAAHITIDAVDSAKAREFIESRVANLGRWQTVLSTLDHHDGGPLAVGLATPWRLSLATTVYEQRDPDNSYTRNPADLIRVAATSNHALREHLLTHFITATTAAHTAESGKQAPYTADQTHRWLAVLADYLHHNATTGRTLGGVPLSGTDLVLHQLWPLGGVNRVRGTVLAATALIWLIATPILLIRIGISLSPVQIGAFASAAFAFSFGAYAGWSTIWHEPARIHTRQLRTQKGRRAIAFGLAFEFAVALPLGLTMGLPLGLVLGLGLAAGLAFGVMSGLRFGLAVGLASGLTFMLTLGARVGVRYVALLLCTRGWFGTPALPWRLGRFLRWCYHSGLVRQAGIGYQFRHRELQDHLGHHPQPA